MRWGLKKPEKIKKSQINIDCNPVKNHTGKVFGEFKVLRLAGSYKKQTIYLVQCSCKKKFYKSLGNILNGKSKRCWYCKRVEMRRSKRANIFSEDLFLKMVNLVHSHQGDLK